jgi:hypothetical protein
MLFVAANQASAINIGGVEIPLGVTFATAQFFNNVNPQVGETLSGYGKIDTINSDSVGDLCGGNCELTYAFDNFLVTAANPGELKFSGGVVQVYLGTGVDKDFSTRNGGGSAGDLAEATNGDLWLTLKGHAIDSSGNTFVATGALIGTPEPTGFGTGLLDVDTSSGGSANAFFDSNGIPSAFGGGNADFQFGSSFSSLNPVYPGECPGGPACLRGSADFTTVAIPEPETYALMLSARGLIGYVVRRRRRV